jgi:hypothetical protein
MMLPAMKNGRIVAHTDGSKEWTEPADEPEGEACGQDHGEAAQSRDGSRMNLPSAGASTSPSRVDTRPTTGQQQGQGGTTQSEQQENSQCEPPLS